MVSSTFNVLNVGRTAADEKEKRLRLG